MLEEMLATDDQATAAPPRKLYGTTSLAPEEIERIKQDVLEECLWITQRNRVQQQRIYEWFCQARYYRDKWWVYNYHQTLSWWLTEMGVSGFTRFIKKF